jgi:hypothetical protein
MYIISKIYHTGAEPFHPLCQSRYSRFHCLGSNLAFDKGKSSLPVLVAILLVSIRIITIAAVRVWGVTI